MAQDISTATKQSEQDNNSHTSPGSLSAFIPTGYSMLDSASGDLNRDQRPDLILVLKRDDEATTSDDIAHPAKRLLLILIRDSNNQLQQVKRSDNTVYCFHCGGAMGDPYMGVTIKNGYFSVEHYGGSAWRWTRIITYKYSETEKEWLLHKDGSESFNASAPEKVTTRIRTIRDFGKVAFEQFDMYKDSE